MKPSAEARALKLITAVKRKAREKTSKGDFNNLYAKHLSSSDLILLAMARAYQEELKEIIEEEHRGYWLLTHLGLRR